MGPSENKKFRLLECELRSDLIKEETVNEIKSAWRDSARDFGESGVKVLKNPFPVGMVRNFVKNPELLKLAVSELKDVQFNEKSNDLYQFKQSDDVKSLTNFTFIPQLYDLIRLKGRTWVNSIVGADAPKTSATFSCYEHQDRLLCHDDKCEDRQIAFILYLMEDWNEDDGGSLALFNKDSAGYPSKIVENILPEFNMLVFFEVSDVSFHQVSEIMSKTKKRLSLNGWFHSDGKKQNLPNYPILPSHTVNANDNKYNLMDYFLNIYFSDQNKIDIKNTFSSQSEIQLDKFIAPKFLEEVESDLRSEAVTWLIKGPPNIRKYEVADKSTLPPSLNKLKEIFESQCWFKYLTDITDLDFAPLPTIDLDTQEAEIPPVCSFEIQRWTHTCYTLIHDKDPDFHRKALDVILRFPFQKAEEDTEDEEDSPEAGHVVYIDSTSRDEECLLHIGYKMNSLGLIFRDKKTLRFIKYLHSMAKPFYLVQCTYQERRPISDNINGESSSSDDSLHQLSTDDDSVDSSDLPK